MRKYIASLHQTSVPITDLVTKFGGQPVWLAEPEWPLSKATGEPMRFICQVALYPEIFGDVEGRMAYVFMTDRGDHVEGRWEPEGGENAVIIQPRGENMATSPLATGPSLYQVRWQGSKSLPPVECEFSVELELSEDPEGGSEFDREELADGELKIGGTPIFLQGEEYPKGEGWRLLLQIDSMLMPFYVDFGDAGIGYAFISGDGRRGKFLWQCS